MDSQVYNLIEMIHTEVQNIKSKMATKEDLLGMATKEDLLGMATKEDLLGMASKEDLNRMAAGLAKNEDLCDLRQKVVVMEDKMDKNFKALYDGQKLMFDKLITLEAKVDRIEQKVEKHDVEIKVIKASAN